MVLRPCIVQPAPPRPNLESHQRFEEDGSCPGQGSFHALRYAGRNHGARGTVLDGELLEPDPYAQHGVA